MTEYLTVPEVAEQLRCSTWSVTHLVRAGRIEASKVAGRWLITQPAVDAYVQESSNRAQAFTRRRRRRRAG